MRLQFLAALLLAWLTGCSSNQYQSASSSTTNAVPTGQVGGPSSSQSGSRAPASLPETFPASANSLPEAPPLETAAPEPVVAAVETAATVDPAPSDRRRSIYKLFFATSRQRLDPPSAPPGKHPQYFSRDWTGGTLTYGSCNVSIPVDQELPPGEIEGSVITFGPLTIDRPDNPLLDVWMRAPRLFSSRADFLQALTNDIPRHPQRSVILGVHGFNNSFEFAGRRLCKLLYDMNFDGTPVLYSWPAGEGLGDYNHDFNRAQDPAEIQLFSEFVEHVVDAARLAGASNISLVAHSMGNRLLHHAAFRLAERRPDLKVDSIVLAAPDIPRQGFENNVWPKLKQLGKRCALYVSKYDRAIFGSEIVNQDGARLGQWNQDGPIVIDGLETIDASEARRTFLDHDYYLRTSGVNDLKALLIEGLIAPQRLEKGFLRRPVFAEAAWFELVPSP